MGMLDCRDGGCCDVTCGWGLQRAGRGSPHPPAERNSAASPRLIRWSRCCCDWCDPATHRHWPMERGSCDGLLLPCADWWPAHWWPAGTVAAPAALEDWADEAGDLPEVKLLLLLLLLLLLKRPRLRRRRRRRRLRLRLLLLRRCAAATEIGIVGRSNWCRWMVEVEQRAGIGRLRVVPVHRGRRIDPCPARRWPATLARTMLSTTCWLEGFLRDWWLTATIYLLEKDVKIVLFLLIFFLSFFLLINSMYSILQKKSERRSRLIY